MAPEKNIRQNAELFLGRSLITEIGRAYHSTQFVPLKTDLQYP